MGGKKNKFEESKEGQGLGHFVAAFKPLTASLDQIEHSLENHLITRNISVSRPSMISDLMTKNDFYEGVIEKQSPSFHKMWQKRYFVLKNRILFYYKSK